MGLGENRYQSKRKRRKLIMKTKIISFTIMLLTVTLLSSSFAQDNTQAGLPEGAIARLGKGGINIMRFSPDGTHLAVGTDVGVWLYDVPDGKETALFTGHTGHVNALAFSPDGKTLASGGFSNPIIQLWDIETGTKLSKFTLTKARDSINALAFSKDVKTLISLDMFGRITHWDIKTGSKSSNSNRVQIDENVVFSPENNVFATGHRDGKIRLWDATTGKRQANLTGHARLLKRDDKDVWALAFSHDGKMLASGSHDKTVKLWNADNRKNLATFKGHNGWVIAVAFSADGSILASGDTNKVIKFWDVNTKQERATLIGHTNAISALTFSPDGKTLASGSYDGTIQFWNQDSGEKISTFTTGHTEWVKTVAFSENGTILTSAFFDGTVDVWSVKTKRELTTFTAAQSDNTNGIAFSPDATLLVSQGSNGATLAFRPHGFGYSGSGAGVRKPIQLWDITTGDHIPGPWQDLDRSVNALAISSDNKILVAGIAHRGDILAWDINTGEEMFRFNVDTPFLRKLEFSPNGKLLASSGVHVRTQIWDVATQQEIITPLNMERAEVVVSSHDNTRLAAGDHDRIIFWDITPTGMKEHGKILNSGYNQELIFSPNGDVLVTSKTKGWKNLIQLWGVNNGWDLGTISGHTEEITTLEFSTDGKTLASGSKDGTVLLWDWEKIITKAMNDAIEKNLSNNLAPPDEPVEYASMAEEAEAIVNWMQKNGYKVKKTLKGYTLTGGGGTATVSGGGGGRLSSGGVNVKIDASDVLEIRVVGVGVGTFMFDDEGKLKHKPLDEGKNTNK
jgi:WD40 repeat protein